MAVEGRPELEKELSDIRREVIESRNLVIKTDNLVKTLHAELKSLGKRQDESQKHLWLSAATSYFLFTALVVVASALLLWARTGASNRERDRLEKSVVELKSQVDKQQRDSDGTRVASRAALEAYQQMNNAVGDDRLKALGLQAKLNQNRLSPLEKQAVNDRAESLRKEIAQSALDRGKAAFRKSDMQTAIAELTQFTSLNPPEPELLEASFYLGAAYNHTRQYQQAVPLLAKFVAGEKRAKTRDYAMLLLAQSYQQTGELDQALAVTRDALASYPNSEYASQLRGRMGSVKRLMKPNASDGSSSPKQAESTSAANVPQP